MEDGHEESVIARDDAHEDRSRAGRPPWAEALGDPDRPLYTVGVVAELVGVDVQVVRGYDRRGLVSPARSPSGHRRYSRRDVARLWRAIQLTDDGIPAQGVERILALEDELEVTRHADRASDA